MGNGSWGEFDKAARDLGKGLSLLALAGVAGGWTEKNHDSFMAEAARRGVTPDVFLLALLEDGLNRAKRAECTCTDNLQSIAKCTVHGPKSVFHSPDWSKEDDDYQEPCPNEHKCEHPDDEHLIDGTCQICDCKPQAVTDRTVGPPVIS